MIYDWDSFEQFTRDHSFFSYTKYTIYLRFIYDSINGFQSISLNILELHTSKLCWRKKRLVLYSNRHILLLKIYWLWFARPVLHNILLFSLRLSVPDILHSLYWCSVLSVFHSSLFVNRIDPNINVLNRLAPLQLPSHSLFLHSVSKPVTKRGILMPKTTTTFYFVVDTNLPVFISIIHNHGTQKMAMFDQLNFLMACYYITRSLLRRGRERTWLSFACCVYCPNSNCLGDVLKRINIW